MMANIYFRFDANNKIGRGHLTRCVALAGYLKSNFNLKFIIQDHNRSFCEPLLNEWSTIWISSEDKISDLVGPEDILVVDSYDFDSSWRQNIKPFVKKLVLINDFPDDSKGADVVINHTPGITKEDFSDDDNIEYLLGLDYLMLRPEFIDSIERKSADKAQNKGLFVYFGSVDALNISEQLVYSLKELGFKDPIYLPQSSSIQDSKLSEKFRDVHIYTELSSFEMKKLIGRSRLASVAASMIGFEVATLNVAMICSFFVENQKLNYKGFTKLGISEAGGEIAESRDIHLLAKKTNELYHNADRIKKIQLSQKVKVDGKSPERFNSFFHSLIN